MAQYAAERAEAAAPAVANPAPLGLCGFALTTFVLSSVNAGFIVPSSGAGQNIVVGLALFYGGVAQLLAGMWEFKAGNTFGATAFTSYGAFWLSFAAILIPGTGILDALGKTPTAVHPALGVYLLGWTIFTGLMLLGALRSNLALIGVFLALFLTFLSLAIGELGGGAAGNTWQVLGGWLGIITALIAWYTALAGVLASTKSAFQLPTFPLG